MIFYDSRSFLLHCSNFPSVENFRTTTSWQMAAFDWIPPDLRPVYIPHHMFPTISTRQRCYQHCIVYLFITSLHYYYYFFYIHLFMHLIFFFNDFLIIIYQQNLPIDYFTNRKLLGNFLWCERFIGLVEGGQPRTLWNIAD